MRIAFDKMKKPALQVHSKTLGTLAHFSHFRHLIMLQCPKVVESADTDELAEQLRNEKSTANGIFLEMGMDLGTACGMMKMFEF